MGTQPSMGPAPRRDDLFPPHAPQSSPHASPSPRCGRRGLGYDYVAGKPTTAISGAATLAKSSGKTSVGLSIARPTCSLGILPAATSAATLELVQSRCRLLLLLPTPYWSDRGTSISPSRSVPSAPRLKERSPPLSARAARSSGRSPSPKSCEDPHEINNEALCGWPSTLRCALALKYWTARATSCCEHLTRRGDREEYE